MNSSKIMMLFIAGLLALAGDLDACDTWVALPDATKSGYTMLGKNSDRLNFDCQPLLFHPRQEWPAGSMVDMGRIEIPQVEETYATLGSSPYWCWGYEEGVNEFGVAIGNEGIRTKPLLEALSTRRGEVKEGLTGMDLIRLGLERGKTAREAMTVITDLLEEYGQFGSGLPSVLPAAGAYDNSFIIADAKEAWVLETAGRHWVAKHVAQGAASISNTTSITTDGDLFSGRIESHAAKQGWWNREEVFDFTKAYCDETPIGAQSRVMSLPRAKCSLNLLEQETGRVSLRTMMGIARDRSSQPTIDRDNTASSCVAVLGELPIFWWCPARPSNSCYVPFFVHGSGLPEIVSTAGKYGRVITRPSKVPPDSFAAHSYWWRFRELCDKVNLDDEARNRAVRRAFDPLEKAFEEGVAEVVRNAVALRAAGKPGEAADLLDAYTASCVDQVLAKLEVLRFEDNRLIPLEERLEKIAGEMEAKRVELHIPGMALAVVKDDEVVMARGFGLADLESGKPVTEETLFAIGSSTKAFTATLAGMLVDEGKMEWDAPVTRYLPFYALPIDDEVTIRDLLCHRTGYTRMSMLLANGKVPRKEILLTAVKAEPWTGFREKFHYNNVMFLAAGVATGAAGDSDWDTLIRERILAPLGMDSSNTSIKDCAGEKLSLGYEWDAEREEHKQVPMRCIDNIAPAGAINSNVKDMARWLRFLLGNGEFEGERLISPACLRETWKKQMEIASGVGYGLGWMVHETKGQLEIEHGGNIDGFAAQVALLPDSDLGFVLLTNVTATPLQGLSRDIVWNALLEEPKTARSLGIDYTPYVGEYTANFGQFKDVDYSVKVHNGRLAVEVPGQTVYELNDPDDQGKWAFAVSDTIAVSFLRNDEGAIVAMKQYQHGLELELPRKGVEIPPAVPLEEIRKYLGSYQSEKNGDTLEMVIKKNQLALDIPDGKTYMLRAPDEEGRWVFRVLDLYSVSFKETGDGRVESMAYHEAGESTELMRMEPASSDLLTVDALLALRDPSQRTRILTGFGSMKLKGRVRMPQSGLEGTVALYSKGLDRFRRDMDFGKYGLMRDCVNGKQAWTLAPHGRLDLFEGRFLEQARAGLPAALLGDWRDHFEALVPLRSTELDGRKVHVVKLEGKAAPDWTVFVDAETGDVVKTETVLISPSSAMQLPVTTRYEEFVDREGIRIPMKVTTSNEAVGKTLFQFQEIETGCEIDDQLFLPVSEQEENVQAFDRIWQVIHDQYWDQEFNGVDWEELRAELRPRVESARTREEAREIMYEMILSLGASHFAIVPREYASDNYALAEFGVTGIDLRVIDGQALVTRVNAGSPADKAGVRPGWLVLEVDGIDIAARLKERVIKDGPKRELELAYTVIPLLFGTIGEEKEVRFLDGSDEEIVLRIALAGRKGRIVDLGHLKSLDVWIETERLEGNIGYITFNRFLEPPLVMAGFNKAMASFLDANGVIVDLRGNEGGLPEMATGMMGWLIDKEYELGTVFMRGMEYKPKVRPRAQTYQGPVTLLIDGLCGSASELMAAGLQDMKRAHLIGTRTKGEVLPGRFEKLPGGDLLLYTTDNYVCTSGRRPEGEGVGPDLEVLPSRDALLEGRDPVLEAALHWIQNQTVN